MPWEFVMDGLWVMPDIAPPEPVIDAPIFNSLFEERFPISWSLGYNSPAKGSTS